VSLEVVLNVEGQEGVSWQQWLDLARIAEDHGFAALYRSDHYLSEDAGSGRDALDAWGTICGLAATTSRIRLGTLVSPVTFRHPSVLAKLAVTADHISDGRIDVGIGAGWYPDEHHAYGFELPALPVRLEMLEEQLEIITSSWAAGPFTFHGRHYRLENNDARPKPVRSRPRLVLGGSGAPRSLDLAARWADEYNLAAGTADEIRQHKKRLQEACTRSNRDPATMRLSLLTGFVCGTDPADLEERAGRICRFLGLEQSSRATALETLPEAWLVGTPHEIDGQLASLESLGLDTIMLWPPLHDDLESIGMLGQAIAAVS